MAQTEPVTDTVTTIPVEQIAPGNNDRKAFDAERLQELADSIRLHGLAQPVTVRPFRDAERPEIMFQIVAGERRYRAIRDLLKQPDVPCIIRPMTDEQASAIMLVENMSRADLTPIEEANAYRDRMNKFGWTDVSTAEKAGVSTDRVRRRLLLLQLAPEIQKLVAQGQFPLGHAESLAMLDINRQQIALRVYSESGGMPLLAFRAMVGQLRAEQDQESLFDLGNLWVEQVKEMRDKPRRGKLAVTGAPVKADLPAVEVTNTDTAASVIDRYIAKLLAEGLEADAAAIGTIYDGLVKANFLAVPANPQLR